MTFDLKKALKAISKKHDETSAEWGEFQEAERQKLNQALSGLTEVDLKIQHGRRAVEIAEAQIERLKSGDDTAALEFEFERMAEGYALQGDFEKAVQFASNADKRAEYQLILDAINRSDNDTCECPKEMKQGKGSVQTTFIKDRFYTKRGVCELYYCTICGFQNARC